MEQHLRLQPRAFLVEQIQTMVAATGKAPSIGGAPVSSQQAEELPQDAALDDEELSPSAPIEQSMSTAPELMVFKKSDLQLKRKEDLLKIAEMYKLQLPEDVKRQEVINAIVAEQEKAAQPAGA